MGLWHTSFSGPFLFAILVKEDQRFYLSFFLRLLEGIKVACLVNSSILTVNLQSFLAGNFNKDARKERKNEYDKLINDFHPFDD